jgi:hypothetical protein
MDVPRIRALQSIAGDRLTVLPAIELRSELGAKPIHYICIFPEDCDLDHVWATFQGSLGLTPTAIREKGGDQVVYVPIKDGAALAHRLGGLVSIHAGAKSNSLEEIQNTEAFQQRIKYDIAKDHIDLFEIGQIRDIDRHHRIIFPRTGLDLPLVTGSDNHDISNYQTRAPLWIRANPTFRGLLMLLREPQERRFIGAIPPEVIRAEQNPTKYVRSIGFTRRPEVPPSEEWFSGDITFNHGLVAIIGNKGSGKSALADTLGLLGGTRNSDSFSFLSTERFRHPTSGLAKYFDATLVWESGEPVTKCLEEAVRPEEVERLKYLPQDHVERVCNEIAGPGREGFEQAQVGHLLAC